MGAHLDVDGRVERFVGDPELASHCGAGCRHQLHETGCADGADGSWVEATLYEDRPQYQVRWNAETTSGALGHWAIGLEPERNFSREAGSSDVAVFPGSAGELRLRLLGLLVVKKRSTDQVSSHPRSQHESTGPKPCVHSEHLIDNTTDRALRWACMSYGAVHACAAILLESAPTVRLLVGPAGVRAASRLREGERGSQTIRSFAYAVVDASGRAERLAARKGLEKAVVERLSDIQSCLRDAGLDAAAVGPLKPDRSRNSLHPLKVVEVQLQPLDESSRDLALRAARLYSPVFADEPRVTVWGNDVLTVEISGSDPDLVDDLVEEFFLTLSQNRYRGSFSSPTIRRSAPVARSRVSQLKRRLV